MSRSIFLAVSLLLAFAFPAVSNNEASASQGKTCFSKKIDKVVRADNVSIRLKNKEVALVLGDNVKVQSGANTIVCAGGGRQIIKAGKGTSLIDAGPGDDAIYLHQKSWKNRVFAGSGNDFIRGSKGNDSIYASPKKGTNLSDRDRVISLGGNDRVFDFAGKDNTIYTGNGSDRVWSLGTAVSRVWGGNGSDFLYSNGAGQSDEEGYLFGERGNDRLLANQPGGRGGAFLDPGPGDDWIKGSNFSDRILFQSGIKKINALGGNDLILSTSKGRSDIYGGAGVDTISFAPFSPREEYPLLGVKVNLETGEVRGQGQLTVNGFENVIGSAFEDTLTARNGKDNILYGGIGDDKLFGNIEDEDRADGGLGVNECLSFVFMSDCNLDSPATPGEAVLVDIDQSGVLLIIGSHLDEEIILDYSEGGYTIQSDRAMALSGLCFAKEDNAFCPDEENNMNGVLLYSEGGDDEIVLRDTLPATLTTTIHAGSGANIIRTGKSKDTILTAKEASVGSVIFAGSGVDNIYLQDDVIVNGQGGADVIHAKDPCLAGEVSGGAGRDNLVFAGAKYPIWASIGLGRAGDRSGQCGKPLLISGDIEGLEGSQHNDHLILGKRFAAQEGPGKLLGREGRDTLDARNGYKDTVTTGAGGRDNKVLADKKDKIIWGWGLSGY